MDKDEQIRNLEARINELEKVIAEQDSLILAIKKVNEMLTKVAKADSVRVKDLIEALKRNFQSSTEQLLLFDDIENTANLGTLEEMPESSSIEVKSYVRKKARTGIELPANTPVVDIYDDTSIETCPRCNAPMKEVGEKVYESFTKITYTAVVRKHVKQYRCTSCEPVESGERVVETPVTGSMLDGTVCDPTLLAQIVENKFSYAQPLYRQAEMFKDIGLSRFTMSAWLMKVGNRLVENLVPCLEKAIYSYPLVNVDETPVEVLGLLDKDGKRKAPKSTSNGFMVVRAAVDESGRNGPVLFTFSDNRRLSTITEFLKPYKGVVQTDGLYSYSGAEKVCDFTHIGCLVHARRKAYEACGNRTSGTAYELLKLYASFFHEEDRLKEEVNTHDYLTKRRQVLLPILENIKAFCESNVDKAIGKLQIALRYPLDRWDTLIKFLDYSFASSNNQRAENAIRPFAVGRKNWLFNITEEGAEVSGMYYSLVESCKSQGINVQDYLTYVFLNANTIKDGDEEAWTKMLPGRCDISSVKVYRDKIMTAKADPSRTEPYRLRGKRV